MFTHPSGRTVGLNLSVESWEACRLVADEEGFQHALLVAGGAVHLYTRRQPGRPEDREARGTVEEVRPA